MVTELHLPHLENNGEFILLVEHRKFTRLANKRFVVKTGYRVGTGDDSGNVSVLATWQGLDLILLDPLLPKLWS